MFRLTIVALVLAAGNAACVQAAGGLAPNIPEKWRNENPADDPVDRYVISTEPRTSRAPAGYARRERAAEKTSTSAEPAGNERQSWWATATAWPWFWPAVGGGLAALIGCAFAWRWSLRRSEVPSMAVFAMSAAPARRAPRPATGVPERRKAA